MARRLKDQVGELASIIENQRAGDVAVDSASSINELEPEEPLFVIDHRNMKEVCARKARATIERIVNHVMSEEDASSLYVKQKMEMDIDSLTNLFVRKSQNDVVIEAILNKMGTDGVPPRLSEVLIQYNKIDTDLNKQILESEAVYRATYTQLKFEVQQRRYEGSHLELSSGDGGKPRFNSDRISLGTKDMIKERLKKKKELIRGKVEDAVVIEDEDSQK